MQIEQIATDRPCVEKQFCAWDAEGEWIISVRRSSTFSGRALLKDVVIHRAIRRGEVCGITMERDGKLYRVAEIIAWESGEPIRSHDKLPAELNSDFARHAVPRAG